ncbi:hypothetical protein B0H13DRAFT_1852219 [Mycena leptocephala]|nr:hypothetical protein B0H13DRAFT_1852219 [Mycena leptocephala]
MQSVVEVSGGQRSGGGEVDGRSVRDDVAALIAAAHGERRHVATNRRVASVLKGVGGQRQWPENEGASERQIEPPDPYAGITRVWFLRVRVRVNPNVPAGVPVSILKGKRRFASCSSSSTAPCSSSMSLRLQFVGQDIEDSVGEACICMVLLHRPCIRSVNQLSRANLKASKHQIPFAPIWHWIFFEWVVFQQFVYFDPEARARKEAPKSVQEGFCGFPMEQVLKPGDTVQHVV